LDDNTVLDEWRLFRRIPSQPRVYIVWDKNRGEWRISSQAFKGFRDDPRKFSVYIENVLVENGLDASSVLLDAEKFAIAAVTAAFARGQGQEIERNPLPNDPSHAHVVGDKKKPVPGNFADAAQWVIQPVGWPWPPPSDA
jgi:hypothetical protein